MAHLILAIEDTLSKNMGDRLHSHGYTFETSGSVDDLIEKLDHRPSPVNPINGVITILNLDTENYQGGHGTSDPCGLRIAIECYLRKIPCLFMHENLRSDWEVQAAQRLGAKVIIRPPDPEEEMNDFAASDNRFCALTIRALTELVPCANLIV